MTQAFVSDNIDTGCLSKKNGPNQTFLPISDVTRDTIRLKVVPRKGSHAKRKLDFDLKSNFRKVSKEMYNKLNKENGAKKEEDENICEIKVSDIIQKGFMVRRG